MVSEICVPQSLDPICAKFDKFLAHGQAHIGQMGKWPWQCTTTGLDNSTELRTVKIHPAITEIWVPQVWQPTALPPARPPTRTVTTIPLQPGGLRGKKSSVKWRPSCPGGDELKFLPHIPGANQSKWQLHLPGAYESNSVSTYQSNGCNSHFIIQDRLDLTISHSTFIKAY